MQYKHLVNYVGNISFAIRSHIHQRIKRLKSRWVLGPFLNLKSLSMASGLRDLTKWPVLFGAVGGGKR